MTKIYTFSLTAAHKILLFAAVFFFLTTASFAQRDIPLEDETILKSYDPNDDPNAAIKNQVDIFVNAQDGCGLDAATITAQIKAKLANKSKCIVRQNTIHTTLTDEVYRTQSSTVTIDPSDLSRWRVFDHYGSNVGGVYANGNKTGYPPTVTPPVSWTNTFGTLPVTRDYFAYYESGVNVTTPVCTTVNNYINNLSQQKVGASYAVKALDQHIYALKNTTTQKTDMYFVGYGSPAYLDFLYYPTTSSGDKKVNFTVNSNNVDMHTFQGAGFFINTGEIGGYIHGYFVYYSFASATVVNSISLYSINANVTAAQMHQGGFASYCTFVSTIRSNPNWAGITDIQLEIKPTSVEVFHKTSSGGAFVSQGSTTMTNSGYHGFGPGVQYGSHGCNVTSVFQFTNLQMQFADGSQNILAALNQASFYKKSEKYFINLLCNDDTGCSLTDWEGVARMQQDSIRYITNVKNTFLNDGGCTPLPRPLLQNGKSVRIPSMPATADAAYINRLTDSIVSYILGCNGWTTPTTIPQISKPVAIFTLADAVPSQIEEVHRKFIQTNFKVGTIDNSKPTYSATNAYSLQTWHYKITDNVGFETNLTPMTAPANNASPLFTFLKTSTVGEYKVDLYVLDNNTYPNNKSNTVQRIFKVTTDDVAPVITIANSTADTIKKLTITDLVNRTEFDFDLGVKSYEIEYVVVSTSRGILYNNQVIKQNITIKADSVVLNNAIPTFTNNSLIIPPGEYTLRVTAWDLAGNKSIRTLAINIPLPIYNITFVKNGGANLRGTEPPTYTAGISQPLPTNMYIKGKTFMGWTTTNNCNDTKYFATPTNISGDITYYACFVTAAPTTKTGTNPTTGGAVTIESNTTGVIPGNSELVITDITSSFNPNDYPPLRGGQYVIDVINAALWVSAYPTGTKFEADGTTLIQPNGSDTVTIDIPVNMQGKPFYQIAYLTPDHNLDFIDCTYNSGTKTLTFVTGILGDFAIITANAIPEYWVDFNLYDPAGNLFNQTSNPNICIADYDGSVEFSFGESFINNVVTKTGYKILRVVKDGLYSFPLSATDIHDYTMTEKVTGNHVYDIYFTLVANPVFNVVASAGTDGYNNVGGSITIAGTYYMLRYQNITFDAKARTGYYIKKVVVNGSNVYTMPTTQTSQSGMVALAGPVSYLPAFSYSFISVTANNTIQVHYNNTFNINYISTDDVLETGDVMVVHDIVPTYNYGTGLLDLPHNVTRPCCSFMGWYNNSALDSMITSIPSTQFGDVSFFAKWNCITQVKDVVNKQDYTVLPLAGRCWFRENTRATKYQDGDTILNCAGYTCATCATPAQNIATFGRLYNFAAATSDQICPEGWSLPTSDEWGLLSQFNKEHIRSTNYWLSPNNNNNAYTFTMLPAGYFNSTTNRFEKISGYAGYWAYSTTSSKWVCCEFTHTCNLVTERNTLPADMLSVRCIQDIIAPTTVAVTFESNGGTGTMANQLFTQNVYKSLAANGFTAPTGMEFKNWNEQANGLGVSYIEQAKIKIAANLTLYAQWQPLPATYTISFNGNGGTGSMASQTYTHGVSQIINTNSFTKTGSTFVNWNTASNGTGTAYANNYSGTINATTTLFAQWSNNNYTLMFNTDGVTVPATISSIPVTYGVVIGALISPTKVGYIFAGWKIGTTTINASTTWNFTTNQTAVAQWTAQNYTLSFDATGGSAQSDITATYNAAIGQLPVPVWTGHTFLSWKIDGVDISAATVWNFTSPKTATAVWTNLPVYTLNLLIEPNNYPQTPADTIKETFLQGIPKKIAYTPNKPGYDFEHWTTDFNGTETVIADKASMTLTSDSSLYAQYHPHTYKITFDVKGGVAIVPDTMKVYYDNTIGPLPTTTKTGYNFEGWFIDDNKLIGPDTTWHYPANKIASAHWSGKPFDLILTNGRKDGVSDTILYVVYDAQISTLFAPTKAGYTFGGWWIESDSLTIATVWNYLDHKTATAVWTANSYTLNFNNESGAVTLDSASMPVTSGVAIGALQTPVKAGYSFVKWQIDAVDIAAATLWNYPNDQTADAVWTANSFDLTLEKGCKDGISDTILTVVYGLPISNLFAPTKIDSLFLGWVIDGTDTLKTTTIWNYASDKTAVGTWQEKTKFTVTFDNNGGDGTETMADQIFVDGVAQALTKNIFTNTGLTFKEWNTDADGLGTSYTNQELVTLTTAGLTLYAIWE